MTRLGAVAALLATGTGCFGYSTAHTGKVLAKGDAQMHLGANAAVLVPDPDRGYQFALGSADAGAQYGVTDDLTVGGRLVLGLVSGAEADARLGIVQRDPVWIAVGLHAGYTGPLAYFTRGMNHLALRPVATFRLSEGLGVTLQGSLARVDSYDARPAFARGGGLGLTFLDAFDGEGDFTALVSAERWGRGEPLPLITVAFGLDLF